MRIAMVFVHGTIFETSNISILKKNRINATEPKMSVTLLFNNAPPLGLPDIAELIGINFSPQKAIIKKPYFSVRLSKMLLLLGFPISLSSSG